MIGWLVALPVAFADDCPRVPLEKVTLAMEGATEVAVRDVTGGLEIVAAEGDTVRAGGWACAPGAQISLAREKGVIVVTVHVPREVEGLELELVVPRSLAALTVDGHTGPVQVDAVPARVGIVNGTGPVVVHGAGPLRVVHVTGLVEADDIGGNLVVDQVIGPLIAGDVNGDVLADGITGPVSVTDVKGDLDVEGGIGKVLHSGVDGQVRLH